MSEIPNNSTSDLPDWYSVCLVCTAKFHSRQKLIGCPRCDSTRLASVRAGRPWLQDRSSESKTGKQNADQQQPVND